jgi:L-iditol 2-dehydrogenase
MRGQHNVCANIKFLSSPQHPGFFRELINLPATNFLPIPAGVSFSEASLIEPLAVAVHSLKVASIQSGETVAVFGAGPIGLLTVAALKAAGAGRIWAVEPLAHRRELARNIGADVVLGPDEATPEILRQTGQRGVDCAIDCAAKEDTTNQAIQLIRNAGRMALTGIHSERRVSLEGSTMRRKELAIFNVRRSNHESQAALDLLAAHPDWFAPVLTHAREMNRIGEAFAIASEYRDGVGKMIIQP